MSDGRKLDADVDTSSWIKDKMALLVCDGTHGMEYSAIAESDPYLVENVGWLVEIRYTLSGQRDNVLCAKCINPLTRNRASRVRKTRTKPQITRRKNKPKATIKKKKGRGRPAVRPSRPPSVIDLTSVNDSDMFSLDSFSVPDPENVARLPPPEEREEEFSFGELFVARDIHTVTPSFTDDDSDMNKKPAAVSIDTATTKSTASRSARVKKETEEKEKQQKMKQFKEAKDALRNLTSSAQDVEQVLKELGPPYTLLQTATLELQRRRKETKTKEQLELFVVEIGMIIKKPFDGTLFEGIVIREGDEEVIKNGKLVKVWKVVYEDGDEEELDWGELLRWHVRTPDPDLSTIRGRAMQALELFCGSGVVSQEFRQRNWNVISLDIDEHSNATLVQDILKMKPKDLDFVPDFIWASLPCHTYSCAAGSYHRSARKGQYESSEEARRNNFLFCTMWNIMKWAKRKHPHLVVVIENPVGQLSKMPLMEDFVEDLGLEMTTVHYCAFGRAEKKPTHIWTNDKNLIGNLLRYQCPRNCRVNHRHESVQANRSKIDYSVIPQKLAEEVAENLHSKFYQAGLRWERAATPTGENWV